MYFKGVTNFLKARFLFIFLFALFLIKAPPFYFLPILNRLFSSHTLGKLIIFFIFIALLTSNFKKISLILKQNKTTFLLIMLYFLGQSLSVVTSGDIILFWKSYHNVIIALTIFLLSYFIVKLKKENIRIITLFVIATGVTLTLLELLYLLFPQYLVPLFKLVIQKEVLNAYLSELLRGRSSLTLELEMFIPFFLSALFLLGYKTKISLKLLFSTQLFILFFLSFLSNFRNRVLNSLFSIIIFFIILAFKKNIIRSIRIAPVTALIVIGTIVAISVAIFASTSLYSYNVFDRFLLEDRREDEGTLRFRLYAWSRSIEFFQSSPIFGVGLGNYFDERIYKNKLNFSFTREEYQVNYAGNSAYSPYNINFQILSETGLVGFTSYLILFLYFLINDVKLLRKRTTNIVTPHIIASWSAFIYMNFEPASTIFIIGWFWFFRGVIEAAQSRSIND